MKKDNSFLDYFSLTNKFIGDVSLVFEFLKNRKGIEYNIFKNGKLKKYLSSSYLVRDRKKLANNKNWLNNKNDFNKKIIVGYEDLWFFCSEGVWSPSVDAIFMIDAINKESSLNIKKSSSILDYGCGSGVMGISLAKRNKKINSY